MLNKDKQFEHNEKVKLQVAMDWKKEKSNKIKKNLNLTEP